MKHLQIRTKIILGLALSVSLAGFGCKKEQSISTYDAPKETAAPAQLADANPQGPEQAQPAPASDAPGTPGDLRWTLPAGWKQVPVPPNPVFMPAAAFSVAADQPTVLLTISQLPGSPGARSVYENVTRWCRQLKIDPPAESDLGKYVVHLQLGGLPLDVVTLGGASASDSKLLGAILPHGQDTWVFKLSGPAQVVDAQNGAFADFLHSVHFDQSPPSDVAGPPAPAQTPSPTPPPVPTNSAATGAGGAQWVLPAGWTADAPADPGNLRLATIRPSNGPAEIKVSKLGVIGGGPGMNVTRWHREVGLEPVDDEHADAGQQVKFADQPWTIHDYTGPANGGTREIIAMAEAGGNTWYFKLVGPTDVVAKVKGDFEQFLATVKLGQ